MRERKRERKREIERERESYEEWDNFKKKIILIKNKYKKYKYLGYNSNTSRKDYSLYKFRLNNVRLTWCQQVIELIKKLNIKNPKINDLGCNYFQLYKEIKIQKFKCNYFGYDIDKNFIQLGLNSFSELKNKYKIKNISKYRPRKTEISVVSDVLELTEEPLNFLNNVIKTTSKIIILRTFIDNKIKINLVKNKKLNQPYFINQFNYNMILDLFLKKNFFPNFYCDLATENSRSSEIWPNIFRKFFIIVFYKKNYLIKSFETKTRNLPSLPISYIKR
jgi:hypothetical protein